MDNWIDIKDNPPKPRNWPPVICGHINDDWTDAAAVTPKGNFINVEGCEIYPTHWIELPKPPQKPTPE